MPTYDRLTVNATKQKHLDLLRRFRGLCGERSINRTLITLIDRWVKEQDAQAKAS